MQRLAHGLVGSPWSANSTNLLSVNFFLSYVKLCTELVSVIDRLGQSKTHKLRHCLVKVPFEANIIITYTYTVLEDHSFFKYSLFFKHKLGYTPT